MHANTRGQTFMLTNMRCSLLFVLVGSWCLAQDSSIDERLIQLNAIVERDAALPGNPITDVNLCRTAASDNDMMSLSVLPNLRSVDISFTPVSTCGLRLLLRNPALRDLAADGQGMRDQDLQLFSGTTIRSLHLGSNPGITGRGFRDVSLKELVELKLSGCSIQASSLQFLPLACPNLRRLQIEYTDIPAPALRDVARLPCLEELCVEGSSIDDSHLSELAVAKRLKVLLLFDTNVTDRGLRSIAGATELRKLWVFETSVTGEAVSGFPYLESLSIGGPNVTLMFDRIASAAHLKDLEITDSRITNDSLRPFKQHSTLESLELSSCDVAAGAFDELGVRKLGLWHCRLMPYTFANLSNLPQLAELRLEGITLLPEDVSAITQIAHLKKVVIREHKLPDSAVPLLLKLQQLEEFELETATFGPAARQILDQGLRDPRK